jgi:hypothetical protein
VHAVRAPLFGIAALLFAAAAVLVVAGDSMAGKAVAFALFGVASVVAISLVFLAIGRAEDAEREASARPKPPPEPDPHAGEAARRARPRPPRRPT